MATSYAPVSKRVLLPGLAQQTRPALSNDKIALIGGSAAAMAFFVVAALNWTGALYLPVRPGEPGGLDVALDYITFGMLAFLAPYGFIRNGQLERIEKIEDRLPDFLRDVAEAGRFGMTLPDAIISASKGRYGLLTDEIKKMASQLEWGVPVATALRLFEERVPTPLVQRVVSIIVRANEAGGNVADVLTMVARNASDASLADKGRRVTMLTYVTVIYISYGVFLVTILILSAQFLPAMIQAGQSVSNSALGGSSSVSLQFQLVPALFLAFFVAVIAHAVGDGVMAGVLHKTRIAEGFIHATVMLAMGWVLMRFFVPQFS
ncbi:MAG: type II secretion system F family protein [Thermoplasmata archaeon]|nr:type II secretion system F family protein [Thermoplasmata archaeon]MCI4338285.1 type II secretion system F family protein [Thermoplasmata archaeon]MCI4340778.1 type II secretion system F family protein [Thermoplasmata archaeon]